MFVKLSYTFAIVVEIFLHERIRPRGAPPSWYIWARRQNRPERDKRWATGGESGAGRFEGGHFYEWALRPCGPFYPFAATGVSQDPSPVP